MEVIHTIIVEDIDTIVEVVDIVEVLDINVEVLNTLVEVIYYIIIEIVEGIYQQLNEMYKLLFVDETTSEYNIYMK